MTRIIGMKAQTWGYSSRRTKWYDISNFGTTTVDWPPTISDAAVTHVAFSWFFKSFIRHSNTTLVFDVPCGGASTQPPADFIPSAYTSGVNYEFDSEVEVFQRTSGLWSSSAAVVSGLPTSQAISIAPWVCNDSGEENTNRFNPITGADLGIDVPNESGNFVDATTAFAEWMAVPIVAGPFCSGPPSSIQTGTAIANNYQAFAPTGDLLSGLSVSLSGHAYNLVGLFTAPELTSSFPWIIDPYAYSNIDLPHVLWVLCERAP